MKIFHTKVLHYFKTNCSSWVWLLPSMMMTALLMVYFLQTILRLIYLTYFHKPQDKGGHVLSRDLKKSIKSVTILSMWFGIHMIGTGEWKFFNAVSTSGHFSLAFLPIERGQNCMINNYVYNSTADTVMYVPGRRTDYGVWCILWVRQKQIINKRKDEFFLS